MTAGLRAGNCVRLHYLYSKHLPTSGHNQSLRHVACAWVILAHSNCLPVEPQARLYVGLGPDSNKRARQTTSTPTTAPARLALRSNVLSGLAEKFAEAGLLVSSNAKPTAWPDLILSGLVLYGLILYAACQIMACLMPGLIWFGLV